MERTFTAIQDPSLSAKWQALFHERWPAYEKWLRSQGKLPKLSEAKLALEKCRPLLVSFYENLCATVNANEMAQCFLHAPLYNRQYHRGLGFVYRGIPSPEGSHGNALAPRQLAPKF